MSEISTFLSEYDLYENKYIGALNILQKETKSDSGCICFLTPIHDDLLILSTNKEGSYFPEYKGSIIDKIIKKKTPMIIDNFINIPHFNSVSSFLGIPIYNKDQVLGIVLLTGGKYHINLIREWYNFLLILRIKMEKTSIEQKNQKSYIDDKYMKTKDLFLANMSHEIRTPLNGIIGYTQLLLQTQVSEVQMLYIQSVNKCSLNLAQIINDILDFSKLAVGKMKLTPVSCQITEIVQSVKEIIYPKLSQQLIINVSKDIPPHITLDKQKLTQVLLNLLSNAIKYTPSGGVITLSVMKRPFDYLYFNIKDTGIGISRENRNKLFRAFTQIDTLLTKSYDGTGLGLAISKKLVELMKGEISLNSELGQGSEFYFTVKYEGIESTMNKVMSLRPENFKGKSVLLLIDNIEQRIELADSLLKWGFKPTPCSSEIEAIHLLESYSYDFELCVVKSSNINNFAESLQKGYQLLPVIHLSDMIKETNWYLINKESSGLNKLLLFEVISKALSESRYIRKKDTVKLNVKHSILIAEDNKDNQDMLVKMLQSFGYTNIHLSNDGYECIQCLKKQTPDILLLDIKMPRMDGYQVLDYLKTHPTTKSPNKIIPITASVLEEDQAKCRSYGVSGFVKKPIDMKDLKMSLLH